MRKRDEKGETKEEETGRSSVVRRREEAEEMSKSANARGIEEGGGERKNEGKEEGRVSSSAVIRIHFVEMAPRLR